MNIAIDISPAVNESAGIARYTRSVVASMLRLSKDDSFCLYSNYIRGEQEKRKIESSITNSQMVAQRHKIPGELKVLLWSTPISLPDYWCPNSDVLFSPSILELPRGTKKKSVLTVHDMTTFLFPGQRGSLVSLRLSNIARAVINKATHILTISQNTKEDIVRLLSIPPEKITVTYMAADHALFHPMQIKRENIILAVGTIEPRKNLDRLIKAYAKLPESLIEKFRLVIIGASGWNYDSVLKAFEQAKMKNRIQLIGQVSDSELAAWYCKATIFVYPSLYEGFGMPPLEAMACGTPVITSNTSSLPEVVGKAAIAVDPYNVSAITQAMVDVLSKPALAKKLSQAGLVQAKKFSWGKTARETLRVIHSI